MIEITVIGTPAPQGSKKFLGVKAGRGILVESSKKVKPWREAVVYAAIEAMQGRAGQGISGAVSVEIVFTLPKPKSAPKRMKTFPDRKPDLSKLVRSTEDALTDAGVWQDDARVVELKCAKRYPGEGRLAMPVPGAVIRVAAIL